MTKNDSQKGIIMISTLKEQLAVDLNCSDADFDKNENTVKILCQNNSRRRNLEDDLFMFMACFGKGSVVAVREEMKEFMSRYLEKMAGFRCFDMPLNALENELKKYGAIISEIEEFYLLDNSRICQTNTGFDIEILEGVAIEKLYQDHRFHMALGYCQEKEHRDMLAVVAYEGREIVGVAGASNDTDQIWQIGIDVVPEKRKHHAATDIVRIISNEILKRGKIPYYGTAWSNIASKRVAINAGYKPAWVEMKAKKI